MTTLYDEGLQPERTLLAWRRTCLALALACAIGVRFTVEQVGPVMAIVGVGGIGTAAGAYIYAARRYRRSHEGLVGQGRLVVDGLVPAMLTVTLLVVAVLAAVYVVTTGVARLGGP